MWRKLSNDTKVTKCARELLTMMVRKLAILRTNSGTYLSPFALQANTRMGYTPNALRKLHSTECSV